MFKRILAALDGSRASDAALGVSLRWAEAMDAELRGLFVEDEMRFVYFPAVAYAEGGMAVPAELPQEERARVEREVAEERDRLRARFEEARAARAGVRGQFASVRGDVNSVLSREARASDLIVMGRRGAQSQRGGHEAGPTTETMVHDAQRPVLVVPADVRTDGPMLVAYDGSRGAQRVIVPAARMAAAAKMPIVALTVAHDTDQARAEQDVLCNYLAPFGIAPKRLVTTGRVVPTLLAEAERLRAGMIVMGAFGHSPIRELLLGSTTLKVLEDTPCPVLLMA